MKTILLLSFIIFFCSGNYAFAREAKASKKNEVQKHFVISKLIKSTDSLKPKSCTKKQDTIIEFDFEKGRYITSNVRPARGRNVVFKIKNINPFFYKITTTPHDIEFDTNALPEPPKTNTTEDKNVQLPKNNPVENIPKKEADKIVFKDVKESSEVEKINLESIEQLKKKKDNIENEINNLNKKVSILETDDKITILNDSIKNVQIHNIDEITKFKNIVSQKQEEERKLANKLSELEGQQEKKDQLVNLINTYLTILKNNYDEFYSLSNNLLRLNENYQNFIDKIMDPTLTAKEFDKIVKGNGMEKVALIDIENFQRFYERLNKYEESKEKVKKSLEEYVLQESIKVLKSLSSAKDYAESMEESLKAKTIEFNTIKEEISQLEIKRKLNYAETLVRKLNNDITYEMTSQPIQPWGDYLEFDVQISERKSLGENYFLPNKSKSFKYSEFVRGGVRFDFSLGTVFDFGLNENTYEVMDTTSGTAQGYTIKQISDNKYTPIIAAMFHSSIRSSTLCSLAFTLGVSVDPSKLQIESLFPGLSLMVGKKDKIVFTAGPSFRRVNELNDIKYEVDKFIPLKPTDYMIESFKIGFFVGVSWSLTSKQKNIIKIPNQ